MGQIVEDYVLTKGKAPQQLIIFPIPSYCVESGKQEPGDYSFYQIDQNGKIVTRTENSGYYFLQAFIFQIEGEEEKPMEEIISLAKSYFDEMYINIETYKGEQFNNWSKANEK